jgi:two-component system sensor histidine kinase KdpD
LLLIDYRNDRILEYHGIKLHEFDLDAALKVHPTLIVVDELAHTNAPGSRHVKRWQDVEELLEAGIDVYTTVNVQHVESLNDVVAQITGIAVQETLPDTVFDMADQINRQAEQKTALEPKPVQAWPTTERLLVCVWDPAPRRQP